LSQLPTNDCDAMSMDNKLFKQYKAIGHHLKPVVIVTGEPTEAVYNEILRALKDHELIKIRISIPDREDRRLVANMIAAHSGATLVQMIGNIALMYLAATKPNPKLSNIIRHQSAT
jgi:RNA-binding protein